MRQVGWGIVMNWLLVGVLSGGGMSALRGEDQPQEAAGRTLYVTSGRCVGLDLTSLSQEAEHKAQQQLSEQLARLAEELHGRRLSPRELTREQAWLLQQPGVVHRAAQTKSEKSYGLVVERTLEWHLPQQVLAAWSGRLEQQRREQQWLRIAAVGVTLVAWLMGWGGVVVLDRLTAGYHRGVLGGTAWLVLGLGTAIGWAWVFWVS